MQWAKILEALGDTAGYLERTRGKPSRPEVVVKPVPPDYGAVDGDPLDRMLRYEAPERDTPDPYGTPIPALSKAKRKSQDWLVRNVGRTLSAPAREAIDWVVPESPFDLASLPFSKINKMMRTVPAEQHAISKVTGFGTPNETAMSLKRQNAIQAAREKRAGELGVVGESGAYPKAELLGVGVDMKAYQVAGERPKAGEPWELGDVVVKTPRDGRANQKLLGRQGLEEALADKGLAPETFMVETPNHKYMVQDRAEATASRLLGDRGIGRSTVDDVTHRLKEEAQDAGFRSFDLHEANIARMPDGSWKIIDAGNFKEDLDNWANNARQSPRYVSPKGFDKTMGILKQKP